MNRKLQINYDEALKAEDHSVPFVRFMYVLELVEIVVKELDPIDLLSFALTCKHMYYLYKYIMSKLLNLDDCPGLLSYQTHIYYFNEMIRSKRIFDVDGFLGIKYGQYINVTNSTCISVDLSVLTNRDKVFVMKQLRCDPSMYLIIIDGKSEYMQYMQGIQKKEYNIRMEYNIYSINISKNVLTTHADLNDKNGECLNLDHLPTKYIDYMKFVNVHKFGGTKLFYDIKTLTVSSSDTRIITFFPDIEELSIYKIYTRMHPNSFDKLSKVKTIYLNSLHYKLSETLSLMSNITHEVDKIKINITHVDYNRFYQDIITYLENKRHILSNRKVIKAKNLSIKFMCKSGLFELNDMQTFTRMIRDKYVECKYSKLMFEGECYRA